MPQLLVLKPIILFPQNQYECHCSLLIENQGVHELWPPGERTEKELIQAFIDKIAELNPQLVTFNGNSFDLPVVRYRAMVHSVAAPGLSVRPYFNRYTDDAIDLCDALSSFSPQGKATLHELCKVMGLPGKPDAINGGEVASYCQEGRIKEVADYCETDIVNTYRIWLRYELFRGNLSPTQHLFSERNLEGFIISRHESDSFREAGGGRGTGN